MAYIGKTPVIGNFVKLDAITAVNGQAAYTMQNGGSNFTDYESVNQFLVSLNGTIQAPTDSFTVSGSTLTFASNLSTGDVIDFIMVFGNSLSAGTPTDATVSTAKIVDDAVTAAKINDDIISGATELASEPADTDEFLVSDAGTLKRIDYSHIKATAPDFVKLSSAETSSSATTIEFTGLDTSTYRCYMVTMQNLCFTSGNNMDMLWGTSSAYQNNNCNSALISDNVRNTYGASSQIRVLNSMSNAFSGVMWLLPAPNSNIPSAQRGMFGHFVGHQRDHGDRRGGFVCNNNALAGTAFAKFKLFPDSSATFQDGGTVTVYGVKY